jgi:hypothetical protein
MSQPRLFLPRGVVCYRKLDYVPRFFALILAFVFLASLAMAQQGSRRPGKVWGSDTPADMPVGHSFLQDIPSASFVAPVVVRDQYSVPIEVGCESGGAYSPNYIQVFLNDVALTHYWSSGNPSQHATATMVAGQEYVLWIRSDDPIRFFMYFSPPSGYAIEFERYRGSYARANLTGSDQWNRYSVRLLPVSSSSGGNRRLGDTLHLEFPVGPLLGGDGDLGSVLLMHEGPGAAIFDRSSLMYSSDHEAVTVIKSSGIIEKVIGPKYSISFTDYGDGFKATYYPRLWDGDDYYFYPYPSYEVRTIVVEPIGTGDDRVRVIDSRVDGGVSTVVRSREYRWNSDGTGWDIILEGGIRENVLTDFSYSNLYGGTRSERIQVQDSVSVVGAEFRRSYKSFDSVELLFREVSLIDGQEWITEYDYYTSSTGAAELSGMLRSVKYADGNWVKFEYGDFDDKAPPQIIKIVEPFENSSFPTSGDGVNTKVTLIDRVYNADGVRILEGTREVKVGATTIAKTLNNYVFSHGVYDITADGEAIFLQETKDYSTASSFLTTKAAYYRDMQDKDECHSFKDS